MVSGHMRKDVPAKGSRPIRSPSSLATKSLRASFARSSRLGLISLASMDFDTSTPIRISIPLRLISTHRFPNWGRARATNRQTRPSTSRMFFIRRRGMDTFLVRPASRCGEANCCSSFFLRTILRRMKSVAARQVIVPATSQSGWAKCNIRYQVSGIGSW